MMSLNFFFFIYLFFAIISALFVIFSKNPIHSILFLILCFCNISCILIALELDYLPIVFLIIYVGAIAILFIFVIMMLNIKISELQKNSIQMVPIILIFVASFLPQVILKAYNQFSFFMNKNHENSISFEFTTSIQEIQNYFTLYNMESNMKNLGIFLYSDYYLLFIFSSLLLLLAMVGVISLTLQKKFNNRSQYISKQLLPISIYNNLK